MFVYCTIDQIYQYYIWYNIWCLVFDSSLMLKIEKMFKLFCPFKIMMNILLIDRYQKGFKISKA